MKVLLLLSIAALMGVSLACDGVKEGAIQVAGLGYAHGRYYRMFGGVAGSEKQQKLVGYFNVSSKGFSGFSYVHFDFKKDVGYVAYGTKLENAKCYKVSTHHAAHFRILVPSAWPNSRIVCNSTVLSSKVPVSVYHGHFKCSKAKASIGGIFDNKCVPLVIKKRVKYEGKYFGGALIFGNFHDPKPKYFQVPDICKDAPDSGMKRSEMPQQPDGVVDFTR
jgi:hypothetical protein